jgi:hypothetical protein
VFSGLADSIGTFIGIQRPHQRSSADASKRRAMAQVAPLAWASSASTSEVQNVVAIAPQAAKAFGRVGNGLVWTGLYTLHAICAAYLVVAGYIYAKLHATFLYRTLALFQLTVDAAYHPAIAGIHFALASIHGYFLVEPIVTSVAKAILPSTLRARIAFYWEWRIRPSPATGDSLRHRLTRHANRIYDVLLSRDGIFGIHSVYFELFFLAREVIETALQTYQAYTMSCLLPREKLNGFYTLSLVINCWMSPLLHRVCRHNKRLERLLVVLCDIVLDFVSSIGVPVVVAIGYLQQYDPVETDFLPVVLYYTDIWTVTYINEMPLLALPSVLDALSRLVFSLGLLFAMGDVKAVLTRLYPEHQKTHTTVVVRTSSTSRTASRRVAEKLQEPQLQASVSKWVHRVMIVWGIGIAAVYLEAVIRAPPSNCSLPLRPWLVSKPACALVTIDCQLEPHLTGDATDFEAVFSHLDAGSVEHVVFRHCPKVEFTPRFLTFRNLNGVKTYNSTIATWDLDAAVIATAHPRMRFAYMVRTQFPNATLPLGLRHILFPATFMDIEITVSNIEWIPRTLPWPQDMLIGLEYSHLDEFPLVFMDLRPSGLSLAFNRITTIPAEAITISTLSRVHLRGNPIQELPVAGVVILTEEPVALASLSFEYTNVSTLPAWVTRRFLDHVQIYAAHTPLCTQVLQNASSSERESWLQERPWLERVETHCGEDPGPIGLYPVEVDDNGD